MDAQDDGGALGRLDSTRLPAGGALTPGKNPLAADDRRTALGNQMPTLSDNDLTSAIRQVNICGPQPPVLGRVTGGSPPPFFTEHISFRLSRISKSLDI
jgi:hypothetical protein